MRAASEVADDVEQEDADDVWDAEDESEERDEREEWSLSKTHSVFLRLSRVVDEASVLVAAADRVTARVRSDPWSRSGSALRMELRTPMARCCGLWDGGQRSSSTMQAGRG